MFYEGDLQSGIALALQEAKRVVCFVRDDEEESKTWEDEYLADVEVSELLAAKSVALRLTAGTQEVGFLSSFCPINKVPTLVVINNGVLQEYIVAGTSEEELKHRLRIALGDSASQQTELQEQPQQHQQQENRVPPTTTAQQPTVPHTSNPSPFESTVQEPDSTGEDSAAERSRREDIRRGKRPIDHSEESRTEGEQQRNNQRIWKQQQRKREQQQKEERQRVLARIRHDKEERKAKAEERKISSASIPESTDEVTAKNASERQPNKASTKSPSSQFRIQVRVFDGSSIRSSFSPSQTIRGHVRPWIDSQRDDGDAPYTLKQILNPLPNRTISVAEEDQTLGALNLGPTASFVMVPVQTYTEAYSSSQSLPVRGIYAGYNLITSTVGAVAGAVGTFLGYGQAQPEGSSEEDRTAPGNSPLESGARRQGAPGTRTPASNVRTLYSERSEQRNNQLYNGNQLNFEPRKDETKNE